MTIEAAQTELNVIAGAVIGMVLAALSGRLVAAFLFGVDPLDPVTFVTVPAVIVLTAIAADAPRSRGLRQPRNTARRSSNGRGQALGHATRLEA